MCSYKVFFSVTLYRATSISAEMQFWRKNIFLFGAWHFFIFFYVNEFVDVELDPLVAGEVLVVLQVELEGVLQGKKYIIQQDLEFPPDCGKQHLNETNCGTIENAPL